MLPVPGLSVTALPEAGGGIASSCARNTVVDTSDSADSKTPKQRFEKDGLLFITVLIEG